MGKKNSAGASGGGKAASAVVGHSPIAKLAGYLESAGSEGTLISLRIKPGAKTTQIMNLEEIIGDVPAVEQIDVQISAPPREGEANIAVIEFVGDLCGVSKGSCSLVRGMKARDKVVQVCIPPDKVLDAIRQRAPGFA